MVRRRDGLVIVSALVGTTALAWIYLIREYVGMTGPPGAMEMVRIHAWEAADFALMFLMWTVMMVGMMVPSAAPTTMVYAAVARKAERQAAVAAYPVTPVKFACLEHCRSPAYFLSEHWSPGFSGAFRMGLRHGVFCVGCCWMLMALLFIGGVMNLLWIAAIAIFVLAE